jgi:hypothetical protein
VEFGYIALDDGVERAHFIGCGLLRDFIAAVQAVHVLREFEKDISNSEFESARHAHLLVDRLNATLMRRERQFAHYARGHCAREGRELVRQRIQIGSATTHLIERLQRSLTNPLEVLSHRMTQHITAQQHISARVESDR